MKFIFASLIGLFIQPAFACIDISGKYLMYEKFYIEYRQNGCETLTEMWCGPGGSNCGPSYYTWTLDGKMVQEGGNPSNWASIMPEGKSLHRQRLWESGTSYHGNSCRWRDQWLTKNDKGNLVVTYKLFCLQGSRKEKVEMVKEIWALVE
jgi:hypothetical protein